MHKNLRYRQAVRSYKGKQAEKPMKTLRILKWLQDRNAWNKQQKHQMDLLVSTVTTLHKNVKSYQASRKHLTAALKSGEDDKILASLKIQNQAWERIEKILTEFE